MQSSNYDLVVEYRESTSFPGYRAGSDGSVWSFKRRQTWKQMKPKIHRTGYLSLELQKNGKSYDCLVHRFIIETFKGACPPGFEVCHLDHNRTINAISNLQYGTRQDNTNQKIAAGRQSKGGGTHFSVLRECDINKIRDLYSDGVNGVDLSKMYSVSAPTIYKIIHGQIWSHVGTVASEEDRRKAKTRSITLSRQIASSKITPDDVKVIRELLEEGKLQADIAAEFGISAKSVSSIKTGRSWSNIA